MRRYSIFGAEVDGIDRQALNNFLNQNLGSGGRIIIGNHNLHSLYLFENDPRMRLFYDKCDVIHIDGMGLLFLFNILGHRMPRSNRVTYIDWLPDILNICNRRCSRVYYLGGDETNGASVKEILKQKYSNIDFQFSHGFFDLGSPEAIRSLNSIQEFSPHVLFLGMGMPKQEYWLLANEKYVNDCIILQSGACMEYLTGKQKMPPRSLGLLGFEWLYRLAGNPRKFYRRYLIEPLYLISMIYKYLLLKIVRKSENRFNNSR